MTQPVLNAFWLNKYSIWEDHRFTRAREPVNNELSNQKKMKTNRITKIITITILVMSALALGAMKKLEILPLVVIHGKVTDKAGKPIENADVAARYGITYDAPNVRTSPAGSFTVMVFAFSSENSGKGPPSITVTKRGYRQYWGYFSKERFGGPVFRQVSVRLLAGAEEPHIREEF